MENYKEKDVGHYKSCLDAWFKTKFLKCEYLLKLSMFGIAILVFSTILTGALTGWATFIGALSFSAFFICISIILTMLDLNDTYLKKVIKESTNDDAILNMLDTTAEVLFHAGAAFTFLFICLI